MGLQHTSIRAVLASLGSHLVCSWPVAGPDQNPGQGRVRGSAQGKVGCKGAGLRWQGPEESRDQRQYWGTQQQGYRHRYRHGRYEAIVLTLQGSG